jgi:hypothetical protein
MQVLKYNHRLLLIIAVNHNYRNVHRLFLCFSVLFEVLITCRNATSQIN